MSIVSAMFFEIISIFITACANASADVTAQATLSADVFSSVYGQPRY